MVADESDDEDAVEGEELVSRLHRILTRKGHLLLMNQPAKVCIRTTWKC